MKVCNLMGIACDPTSGRELAWAMAVQRFIENPSHGKVKMRTKVPQASKKVLVHVDKVQPSLELKYTGLFRVVRR